MILEARELPETRKQLVRVGDETGLVGYWTLLVGDLLEPEPIVTEFLRDMVLVSGKAQRTTKSCASWLSIPVRFRHAMSWSWEDMADNFSRYLLRRRTWRRDSRGRGQAGPSKGTMNAEIRAVTKMMAWAIDERDADGKPLIDPIVAPKMFQKVEAKRYAESSFAKDAMSPRFEVRQGAKAADQSVMRDRERPRAIPDDHFQELMMACRFARDRFILGLLRAPGMRVGAVASLKRDRFHGASGSCLSDAIGPHAHAQSQPDHPRGDGVRRDAVLPIGGQVNALYVEWLKERKEIKRAVRSPWLLVTFPGPSRPGGEAISSKTIEKLVARLCKKAGVRHYTPHQFRHALDTPGG